MLRTPNAAGFLEIGFVVASKQLRKLRTVSDTRFFEPLRLLSDCIHSAIFVRSAKRRT